MKIDAGPMGSLDDVPARIREFEAQGFDGVVTAEMSSDPFFPLLLAAEHSERIELMTSIAVAFSRNPMILANIGNDLQSYSKGRFILGLGSQIEPHIVKRFSMPWSQPAARMREFILAMRAIWSCWYDNKPLDFRGEFYRHTLMTPIFTPTNNPYGAPRVVLAAVGPKMTEVAGEVADGMLVHAFTTKKYIENVTLPAVERGLAKLGRSRADFQLRPLARRLPALLPGLHRQRQGREGVGTDADERRATDRLLRLDTRLPARSRTARMGRAPVGAQRTLEARRVGGDGQPHQ
jgi:alkanesulfonate monooxygenase SsuD/methylene tetrahydromethanopterin reductase-like flavin-dependent oxidoreductase (luciferase family)